MTDTEEGSHWTEARVWVGMVCELLAIVAVLLPPSLDLGGVGRKEELGWVIDDEMAAEAKEMDALDAEGVWGPAGREPDVVEVLRLLSLLAKMTAGLKVECGPIGKGIFEGQEVDIMVPV